MRDYTTDKYKARKGLYKQERNLDRTIEVRRITLPKLKWMEDGNDDRNAGNTDTGQEFGGEYERRT